MERDLKAAQFSIDILDMLEKKMKGNLSDEEAKLIGHVLYELRLNYVDEAKKKDPEPKAEETAVQPAAETPKDDQTDGKSEPEKPDEA